MGYCLFCSLLLLSTTGVPPLATSADQGGRLVGVHEIPLFVRDRVELTPGTFDGGEPPADPRPQHHVTEDAGAG
ncbi:MAG TPA: hypothetical protein VML91_23160 [Burkholderiales bacterium]|nr:hypothetical protein [Burkholderiales bacterium]